MFAGKFVLELDGAEIVGGPCKWRQTSDECSYQAWLVRSGYLAGYSHRGLTYFLHDQKSYTYLDVGRVGYSSSIQEFYKGIYFWVYFEYKK